MLTIRSVSIILFSLMICSQAHGMFSRAVNPIVRTGKRRTSKNIHINAEVRVNHGKSKKLAAALIGGAVVVGGAWAVNNYFEHQTELQDFEQKMQDTLVHVKMEQWARQIDADINYQIEYSNEPEDEIRSLFRQTANVGHPKMMLFLLNNPEVMACIDEKTLFLASHQARLNNPDTFKVLFEYSDVAELLAEHYCVGEKDVSPE